MVKTLDKPIVVTITEVKVAELEPEIVTFQVTMESERGSWHESFGSVEQLTAFKRGLRAGCSLLGYHLADQDIKHLPADD